MSWLSLAILSALFFSGYGLLAKVLAIKAKNPLALSAVINLSAGVMALGLFLIEPFRFQAVPKSIIWLTLLMTVVYAIYYATNFYAIKLLEVSVLTIIFKLAPIVTFLISIWLFNESLTKEKLIAMLMIIGGNMLAVYKGGGKITKNGLIYALVTTVALGLGWAIDKKASVYYSLPLYVSISYIIPIIYLFLLPKLSVKETIREFKNAGLKLFWLPFFGMAGYYSLIKAFSLGEASKVVLISSSSTILVVLAAIGLLNERSRIWQKMVAAGLVFYGTLLIK